MNDVKISIEYFGASDIGIVRAENQDSFGKFPSDNLDTYSDKGQLFIVADGIGGHAGGREASSLAVETISKTYFNTTSSDTGGSLRIAIEEANKVIHQKAKTSEKFGRMGTTCTVMVFQNSIGTIGQLGDSKVYKIENGKIEQLTMEHTQLNEMLKEGILNEEEAKNYPAKSALSRALGMEEKVKVDIIDNILLTPGQIFILCTDGLSKVNKEEILNLAAQNSPKESCGMLIALANERGGKDNVTVQIIKINGAQTLPKVFPVTEKKIKNDETIPAFAKEKRKINKWLFIIPVLIIVLVVGFLFSNTFLSFITPKVNDNNTKLIVTEDLTENDLNTDPLKQAHQLVNKGSYEKAFMIYRNVLEIEPMNLGALEGVNNIMTAFQKKADKLKDEKKYSEALELYLKIQKEKPEDIDIRNSILLCENHIKYGADNQDTESSTNKNQSIEEIDYQIKIASIDQTEWRFDNINKSQYEVDKSSIKFYGTSSEKISLMNLNINDAVISADIKMFSNPDKTGSGFIVGYNSEPGDGEIFYLLKFNDDNYELQMVSNNSVEQLITIQPGSNKNSGEKKITVKCSGNVINIYEGINLVSSWKGPEKIYGKVGLYADKNVLVKFQNISISGNE